MCSSDLVFLVSVTIWLASRKPAKLAADISPMEALGYRPVSSLSAGIKKTRKTGKGRLLQSLVWEQFTKDKKRTAVVLLSLAASLSVYLCVVTMMESQAARTIVSNYMDMDLVIKNDTGYKEKAEERKNVLDVPLENALKEVKGCLCCNPTCDAVNVYCCYCCYFGHHSHCYESGHYAGKHVAAAGGSKSFGT